MEKADIRAVIDGVTGAPTNGGVADVVPAIVDALYLALHPAATEDKGRAKRVIEAAETR
jgi:hypothetical protein